MVSTTIKKTIDIRLLRQFLGHRHGKSSGQMSPTPWVYPYSLMSCSYSRAASCIWVRQRLAPW